MLSQCHSLLIAGTFQLALVSLACGRTQDGDEPMDVCNLSTTHSRAEAISLMQRSHHKAVSSFGTFSAHASQAPAMLKDGQSAEVAAMGSRVREDDKLSSRQHGMDQQNHTFASKMAVSWRGSAATGVDPLIRQEQLWVILLFAVLFLVMLLTVWLLKSTKARLEDDEDTVQSSDVDSAGLITAGLAPREKYDERDVSEFIQNEYRPRNLLFKVVVSLARFWAVLGIMYWALINQSNSLMACEDAKHTAAVRHMCKYTKACLHSYPILCSNITLVLMVRILVQQQFFYSMLREKVIVDFVNLQIMRTPWPWICAFSMSQGGLHFLLKAFIEAQSESTYPVARLLAAKKLLMFDDLVTCVIPGILFMTFFPVFSDIENVLVPLSRIAELQYTKEDRRCHWFEGAEVMSEILLCRDVRHHDVFQRTENELDERGVTPDVVHSQTTILSSGKVTIQDIAQSHKTLP
jgi:hypothetical protein